MKKRLVAILLVLSMVLSVTVTALAKSPFADVSPLAWYADEVAYAYENGLMDGVGNGNFAPDVTTNRGMLVTMLYRLEGSPSVKAENPFTDVAEGSWYETAVTWAAENGIVGGVGNDQFAPNQNITREQMATIFYRYANYKDCDVTAVNSLLQFADEGAISDYARKALSWANSEDLLQGVTATAIQPQSGATRAQVATVFYRFCQLLEKEAGKAHTYELETTGFWGEKGGWMVNSGDAYVWTGEDNNAERYQVSETDKAISIKAVSGKDVNLMYMSYDAAKTGVSLETGSLRLSIYVSETDWLMNTWSAFELTSGKEGWIGTSSLRWQINRNVITQPGWNDITLKFSDAEVLGEGFDPDALHFFWFAATNVEDGVEFRLKDIRLEDSAKTTTSGGSSSGGSGSGGHRPSLPDFCTHAKCADCGGCIVENCTHISCCTPCSCEETPDVPDVPDTPVDPDEPDGEEGYAVSADGYAAADGEWYVYTGSEYVKLTEENEDAYQTSVDTEDKKEGEGAIRIETAAGRDVGLVFQLYEPANTNLTKENGKLKFWLYVSDPSALNEWNAVQLSSGWINENCLNWGLTPDMVQAGWNEVTLNFSDATETGNFDPSSLNLLWFCVTNKDDGDVFKLDDIRIIGPESTDEPDEPDEPDVPVCEHEKCETCGGCLVENCDCTIEDCCTPCDCEEEPADPDQPAETVTYAITADGHYGVDGAWRVWTGSDYVVLADKGNDVIYKVTVDTNDKKEGEGALQIIAATERDTNLMYKPYDPVDMGMTKENGKITFWLYVSDPAALENWNAIQIASGWINENCLTWGLTPDMVQQGWNEITLNFSDATETGTFDPAALNLFWFAVTETVDGQTFKLDDIRITGNADTSCKHEICETCGGCMEENCTCTEDCCAKKCECEPETECDHELCRLCGGCTVADCTCTEGGCAIECPGEGNHPREASFTAPTVWKYWTEEGRNHLENDLDQSEEGLGYMDGERKYLCSGGLTKVGDRLWSSFVSGDTNERQGNYVVMVTSEDDGQTWSEVSVVIEHEHPNVVASDHTLWTDPEGRLWVFWTQDYLEVPWRNYDYNINNHHYTGIEFFHSDALRGVWCMYAEDGETATPTFSEPVRLCDGMILNKPTVATIAGKETWLITPYMSSWLGLDDPATTETMGPTVYTFGLDETGVPSAEFYSRIMEEPYAQISTFRNYCEPMTVQLNDGRLMMIVRTDKGIEVVYTTDELTAAPYTGGWTELDYLRDNGAIVTRTAARTHLRKLDDGSLLLIYHDTDNASRYNMTAALSYDNGKTWPDQLLLDARAVSYVDAVVDADGNIYVQYDNERYGLMELLISKITVDDIKNGTFGEGSYRNKVINDNDYNKPFTYFTEGAKLLDTAGSWFGTNANSGGYKKYGTEAANAFTSYENGTFTVTSDGTENPTGLVYLTTDPNFIDTGMTIQGGAVVFDIWVDDYTSFVNKWGVVNIGDNNDWVGASMGKLLTWNMRNVIYQNGWNTVWLNLKDATGDKTIDLSHIGGFWLYSNQVPAGGNIKVRNIRFVEYSETEPCTHEKCEDCGGCLVTDCTHTDCCTPCTCVEETPGFAGKKLSVLGASICTYEGVSNDATTNSTIGSNAVYYTAGRNGVYLNDTWWKQSADQLGMELLVNNSWSGSCVFSTSAGTAGAYVDRCVQLHKDTGDTPEDPDVIAIHQMAHNDFSKFMSDPSIRMGTAAEINYETLITGSEGAYTYAEPTTVAEAYAIMLHKISQRYPDAEVYCFTLMQRRNLFPDQTAALEQFNDSLKTIAEHFGAYVVDLYDDSGITTSVDSASYYFNNDLLHPTPGGMDAIAGCFVSSLLTNSRYSTEEELYSVNYTLTDALVKEGTVKVAVGGEPFSASFLEKACHELSVTVTMGGEDITASCYADGVVTIPNVSGNIAITAVNTPCSHTKCTLCGGCTEANCDCTIEDCCVPCNCPDADYEKTYTFPIPANNNTSWVTGGRWCAATNRSSTWNSANAVKNAEGTILTNAADGAITITAGQDAANGGGRTTGLLYLISTETPIDTGVTKETGRLVFDLYVSNAKEINEKGLTVQIADNNYNSGRWINDGNRLTWELKNLGFKNGWNTITLALNDAEFTATASTTKSQTFDPAKLMYLWVTSLNMTDGSQLGVRNVHFEKPVVICDHAKCTVCGGCVAENCDHEDCCTKACTCPQNTYEAKYTVLMLDPVGNSSWVSGSSGRWCAGTNGSGYWWPNFRTLQTSDGTALTSVAEGELKVTAGTAKENKGASATGLMFITGSVEKPINLGVTEAAGQLSLDVYVTQPVAVTIEVGDINYKSNAWHSDGNRLSWKLSETVLKTGWNAVTLKLADATFTASGAEGKAQVFDPSKMMYFRVYSNSMTDGNQLGIRSVHFEMPACDHEKCETCGGCLVTDCIHTDCCTPCTCVEETPGFAGKKLSILSASISTYEGVSNDTAANSTIGNNAVWYTEGKNGVYLKDTWWKQAVDQLDMELLVNNAWSGSCVFSNQAGTPGAYVDRCVQLHKDTGSSPVDPDIIAVYLGTNDFVKSPDALGTEAAINYAALISGSADAYTYAEPTTVLEAYAIMLHKITQRYPNAEIYCFTIMPRSDVFTDKATKLAAFNDNIAAVAAHFDAYVVDLHDDSGINGSEDSDTHYMNGNTVHPGPYGMDALTNCFVSALYTNSRFNDQEPLYAVDYQLTKALVAEGTAKVAVGGEPFSVSFVEKDCHALTVTVTMGGTDITASCYADGVVTIPNVTGNIAITAVNTPCSHTKCTLCGGCTEANCDCTIEDCCVPCNCPDADYEKTYTFPIPANNNTSWVTGGRWCAATNRSSTWNSANAVKNAEGTILTNAADGAITITAGQDAANGGGRTTGLLYLISTETPIDTGVTKETGRLVFDLYVSNAKEINEKGLTVQIADNNYNSGRWINDGNRLTWELKNLGFKNGWNTITLALNDAEFTATASTTKSQTFDPAKLMYFWVYQMNMTDGSQLGVRNVHFEKPAVICDHAKCEICGGCTVENCECSDTTCCMPCNCAVTTWETTYTFSVPAATAADTWIAGGRWCAGTYGSGYWWTTASGLVDSEGTKLVAYNGTEISVTAGQTSGTGSSPTGLMFIPANADTNPINTGVTVANGRLTLEVYVSNAAEANTNGVTVEIGDVNYKTNKWHSDGNRLSWNLSGVTLVNGWNTITLELSDATFTASGSDSKPQTFDPTKLMYFRIYSNSMTIGSQLGVRNVKFQKKVLTCEHVKCESCGGCVETTCNHTAGCCTACSCPAYTYVDKYTFPIPADNSTSWVTKGRWCAATNKSKTWASANSVKTADGTLLTNAADGAITITAGQDAAGGTFTPTGLLFLISSDENVINTGVAVATGRLTFELYVSNAAEVNTKGAKIQIADINYNGARWINDGNRLSWDLSDVTLVNGWNTITLELSEASATATASTSKPTAFDPANLMYFWIYVDNMTDGSQLGIRNVKFQEKTLVTQ